jgi:hypothetical protein
MQWGQDERTGTSPIRGQSCLIKELQNSGPKNHQGYEAASSEMCTCQSNLRRTPGPQKLSEAALKGDPQSSKKPWLCPPLQVRVRSQDAQHFMLHTKHEKQHHKTASNKLLDLEGVEAATRRCAALHAQQARPKLSATHSAALCAR